MTSPVPQTPEPTDEQRAVTCGSTFRVDGSLRLSCGLEPAAHSLRNPFIARFGDRHEARYAGTLWCWDDEEARLSNVSQCDGQCHNEDLDDCQRCGSRNPNEWCCECLSYSEPVT